MALLPLTPSHDPLRAPLRAPSNTHTTHSNTTMAGAIIFIHGLGDSGAGWSHLRHQMPIPDVTWMFPDAPQVQEHRE